MAAIVQKVTKEVEVKYVTIWLPGHGIKYDKGIHSIQINGSDWEEATTPAETVQTIADLLGVNITLGTQATEKVA